MLDRIFEKIDKFYFVFIVVLTLMAVMIIVAFRGIFSAYLDAYEISQKDIQADMEIKKDSLEEAYLWVTEKSTVPLKLENLNL